MAQPLAELLTLLAERGLLTRTTSIESEGVKLTLIAEPRPLTPAQAAESEARRQEAIDAHERRMATGASGRFVKGGVR